MENPNDKEVDASAYHVPTLLLGENIPQDIVKEAKKVVLRSMKLLNVDHSEMLVTHRGKDLIDVEARDEANRLTLPRKTNDYDKVPVVLISTEPIYNSDGTEEIAIYSPGNGVLMIGLKHLRKQFDEKKIELSRDDITVSADVLKSDKKMVGIVLIEEVVHFVQDRHWGRDFGSEGTSVSQNIVIHDNNPIEREAKPLKKKLLKEIYPEISL